MCYSYIPGVEEQKERADDLGPGYKTSIRRIMCLCSYGFFVVFWGRQMNGRSICSQNGRCRMSFALTLTAIFAKSSISFSIIAGAFQANA